MAKIDTKEWKAFVIGDLFEKLQLDIRNKNFNKTLDVSEERNEEFNLPLVNAKHGNNGIMYYGREKDFNTAEMTIDIVQNGAIATGDVYAQPQRTGVLWDAYLIKPRENIRSPFTLMFLATVLEKSIKDRFCYDDKCVWDKAKQLKVELPVRCDGNPDWAYMNAYMSGVMKTTETCFEMLEQVDENKHKIDTAEWKEFRVGDLFPNIVKPVVLHTRQVVESAEGIPYVVRTKFDNGIKCRVQPVAGVTPSPAGVISWGAENATFFYQEEPFLSGRDIYYIDTRTIDPLACMFLTSCLQTIAHKYPYNFGLFPDLLKTEKIKLPVTAKGTPDWTYMADCMRSELKRAEADLDAMKRLA
ncbi:hypothetical protein [uncultured Gemmiger sp.]|uniref:hypothetical protein n=1 Tax=uncultured Gemmiger sp. TaxID=1623490 RepID=UPI0025F59693|nr:hypothetical protein [uncultured Gemmiger sp.]